MQDNYTILLILQASSMSVALTLCLLLVLSRYLKVDTTKAYEHVRMMLVVAMFIEVLHYILQIWYGFRLQGDDVGAVINILFYAPVSYILSYATVRIGCGQGYHRQHNRAAIISYLLIVSSFLCGYFFYDSLHIKNALYVMGLLFLCTMLYFVVYPIKEIRRISKIVDDESGEEQVQFNIYMKTSSKLFLSISLLIPFIIFYTPFLIVVGPLFMVAQIFFIISFIALGFRISGVSKIINEETIEQLDVDVVKKSPSEPTEKQTLELCDEDKKLVGDALEAWHNNRGFAQTDLNSAILAVRLNVPKRVLIQYLREVEGKTFRVWLSDLRFEEAKRMLIENDNYSNEAIAEACGISRIYLQNKFKEMTGLTPSEWRASIAK